MSKLKQWIILLGVILAVGVGAFFLGNFNANVGRGQLLNESHMEQQLAKQEYGNDMKIKNVVKNIEQQSSIILVEETGIANVELNKSDAKWNSWLTSSSFSYSAEYKAVLGIDSDNLTFVKDGDIDVETFVKKANGEVLSMIRYEVGEGMEKRVEDFASEVAKQMNQQ